MNIRCRLGLHMPVPAKRLKVEGRLHVGSHGLFKCLRCGMVWDEMRPTAHNYWTREENVTVIRDK